MSVWREPRHVTQRDPKDPQAFSHCWAAVGAWLLDAATDGGARVTAKEFAKAAGGGSGRKSGAGTHEDVVNGLNHYGVRSTLLRIPLDDAKRVLGIERRAVFAIATDYDAWPEKQSCQRTTIGPDVNHEVGAIGGSTPRVMNPLCDPKGGIGVDYQAIPLDTLIAAAAKYAKQQGHSRWIEVVRVYRQKPADSVGDKARIADLEDQVAERDDYIASARALFAEGMGLAVPK